MARGPLPALLAACVLPLAALRAAAQAPSGEAVNAAIDRGVDFLLRSQNRDGSFGVDLNERGRDHMDLRDGAGSLAVYTLLKCGVAPDHPAIQRAVAFLAQSAPRHTYAAGIQLHALGALQDAGQKKRMQGLLDTLVDLQLSTGWDYPTLGRADLSNTQVAALGLRAADAAGLDVPRAVWSQLVEATLRYQERPVAIPGTEKLPKDQRRMAGFFYEPGAAVTGAMTTAGLTILGIVGEDDDRLDHRFASEVAEARGLALRWLERHFSVAGNPGGEAAWHFYYLYGLERVGAFCGLERIGEHDWYAEGAAQLLREQRPAGGWWNDGRSVWPPAPLPISNTCFALLFLRRATFSGASHERATLYLAEDEGSHVWVRVDAKRSWTMWVTGFARGARSKAAGDAAAGPPAELRVERVDWWVGGALAGTVPGDATKPWSDERYPLRHEPAKGGTLLVECRVTVRDADGAARELRSRPLEVRGEERLEPWMMEYARDAAANALAGVDVVLTASSEESEFHPKADALDGLQGSAWWARADDPSPWLRLEFPRGVRLKELRISPAGASEVLRAECARFDAVELVVDGQKTPFAIPLDPDERQKTRFVLPKPQLVRSLELRLPAPSGQPGKCVGLAEIEAR